MRRIMAVIGMCVAMGILASCGGSSSSSGPSVGVAAPAVTTQKAITTKADAAKTVSSSTQMATSLVKGHGVPDLSMLKPAGASASDGHLIVATVLGLKNKLAAIQQRPRMLSKSVSAAALQIDPIVTNCGSNNSSADGTSTMTFKLDAAAKNLTEFSITSNNCKNDETYSIENGSMAIIDLSIPLEGFDIDTFNLNSVTLKLNLTTTNYAYGAYTTKSNESVQKLTLNMGTNITSDSMDLKLDGTMNEIDYEAKTSSKSAFTNFSMSMDMSSQDYTLVLDGVANMETHSVTNPKDDTKSGMTFDNLKLVSTGSSVTIDGTYAIATIPSCMDGTFVITTQTPITNDYSGNTTGGKMTVNGVVMVFDKNGGVKATLADGTPLDISATEAEANACELSFQEGIF